MTGMYVVQMSLDHVVRVIAVRHRIVSAAWAMPVGLVVTIALVILCARRRVRGAHADPMLLHLRPALVVKVPVVKIVLVTVVLDTGVAAIRAVNVGMRGPRMVRVRVLRLRLWRHVPSGW
jgi:uncharacterized paraquat-inducible protein A